GTTTIITTTPAVPTSASSTASTSTTTTASTTASTAGPKQAETSTVLTQSPTSPTTASTAHRPKAETTTGTTVLPSTTAPPTTPTTISTTTSRASTTRTSPPLTEGTTTISTTTPIVPTSASSTASTSTTTTASTTTSTAGPKQAETSTVLTQAPTSPTTASTAHRPKAETTTTTTTTPTPISTTTGTSLPPTEGTTTIITTTPAVPTSASSTATTTTASTTTSTAGPKEAETSTVLTQAPTSPTTASTAHRPKAETTTGTNLLLSTTSSPGRMPDTCLVNGTVYMVGMSIVIDSCEKCTCSSEKDPVTKENIVHCETLQCNTSCPLGHQYMIEDGECCGKCIEVACKIKLSNNTVLMLDPDEILPLDNCSLYRCEKIEDQFVAVQTKRVCPEYEPGECDPDETETTPDGCCKKCKPPSCKPYSKKTVIRHGDCESPEPVELAYCEGNCPGSSVYSLEANQMQHECSCCQEFSSQTREVTLTCQNGTSINYNYVYVERCQCVSGCMAETSAPHSSQTKQGGGSGSRKIGV
ncbi:PREDICTED: mucin-5AC-like, partial [Merops nubicus]|uniref:mucin-5AC-like n=1 Tax=Merops nubicus TaxID=57421 RepID=UPI0004F0495D